MTWTQLRSLGDETGLHPSTLWSRQNAGDTGPRLVRPKQKASRVKTYFDGELTLGDLADWIRRTTGADWVTNQNVADRIRYQQLKGRSEARAIAIVLERFGIDWRARVK